MGAPHRFHADRCHTRSWRLALLVLPLLLMGTAQAWVPCSGSSSLPTRSVPAPTDYPPANLAVKGTAGGPAEGSPPEAERGQAGLLMPATLSSPTLPYGVNVVSAGYTFADLVPAINFTNGSGDRNCSAPSANLTRAVPEVLSSRSPSLLCLNGVGSGVVSSTWQANLSNYTTFHNATTTLTGCPPLPNQTGCAFFASNRYTGHLSEWEKDSPTNSSTDWYPDLTGYAPNDRVFYILLAFNGSAVLGGVYSLTVNLVNATPAPVTFYVRTPLAGWSGSANVTVTFDATVAWMTLIPSSGGNGTLTPEVIPSIPAFHVSGSAPPLYPVTFTESGLPAGTEWYVNITTGGSQSSTTTTVTASLPNGTYTFSVASANKSYSALRGSLTVNGTSVPTSVPFRLVTYPVTFTETGLPTGTNWSVDLEGTSNYSTGTTVTFSEPNASYAFKIGSISGYVVNRPGGSLDVRGAGTSVPLTFTSTPRAATLLGLPTTEGYAVVVSILVTVVAGGVMVGRYRTRRNSALSPPTGQPPSPTEPSPPG